MRVRVVALFTSKPKINGFLKNFLHRHRVFQKNVYIFAEFSPPCQTLSPKINFNLPILFTVAVTTNGGIPWNQYRSSQSCARRVNWMVLIFQMEKLGLAKKLLRFKRILLTKDTKAAFYRVTIRTTPKVRSQCSRNTQKVQFWDFLDFRFSLFPSSS